MVVSPNSRPICRVLLAASMAIALLAGTARADLSANWSLRSPLLGSECLAIAQMLYPPAGDVDSTGTASLPVCAPDSKCGSGLLRLLSHGLANPALDPDTKSRIVTITETAALDQRYTTEHFSIEYTDNPDDPDCVYEHASTHPSIHNDADDPLPMYVFRLAEYLEHSLAMFISYGFRVPHAPEGTITVRLRDLASYGMAWGTRVLIEIDNDMLGRTSDWVYPYLQITAAHELFHRIQLAYIDWRDADWAQEWIREGTAMWAEDAVYDDTNDYVRELGIGGSHGFMANPDQSLINLSYDACLYWKFITESYGTVEEEPQVGADLMQALWAEWETSDSTAALDATLPTSFEDSVLEWARCNRLKDFGDPYPGYDYIEDEDCPHDGGSSYPEFALRRENLGARDAAYYPNRSVRPWACDYFEFALGSRVQTVTIAAHAYGGEIRWQILPIKDGLFTAEEVSEQVDYSRILSNEGHERLLILVTGLSEGGEYDVSVSTPGAVTVVPNPFISGGAAAGVSFFGEGVPFSTLEIYSAEGRVLASLSEESGATRMTWDGRQGGGSRVASGVHFWVCRNQDRRLANGRLVVIR